jgi:hypothetical protein
MKKLSYLALAATLALSGIGFAAPAFADGRLSCNSSDVQKEIAAAKQQLAQQLQLSSKGGSPTIDDWNGCLKVSYTDANGHNVVQLYDPESLALVNTLS